MKKISELTDKQLCDLIDNRWESSSSVWDTVSKVYDANLKIYKNEPEWLQQIPKKKSKVRANRIFVDMESVVNSLIANPPKPSILPGRQSPESKDLATKQEKYFQIKYQERNIKEVVRKGLRNLYYGRLIVIKPFWDAKINDFNARAIDPRKVRFGKMATKEEDSEFAIEEITDNLMALLRRFPKKKEELLKHFGYETEDEAMIANPEATYKEAWMRDNVVFKLSNIILGTIRNPYWDWDGLLMTPEEDSSLQQAETVEQRRNVLAGIKQSQEPRRGQIAAKAAMMQQAQETGKTWKPTEDSDEMPSYQAYYFNHFDNPRKPYIFGTIFNSDNSPIGHTDMITQSAPLQENIDERKRDITENAKIVNGTILVDSNVMGKEDAQRLRYEAGGVIWGKGVVAGVKRETGPALPAFYIDDMNDSRQQIDDIMAASSAFKGNREGQETKGGRLALIEQSFLRLNEMVQLIDYVSYEMFNWFYQLAKVKYTEHHYAKTMGKEQAVELLTLMQDDFEDGSEVRVIGGKTLPEDRQFKYEQAQADVQNGIISPVDYLEVAGYDSPQEMAKNRVVFDLNRPIAVGITPEELQQLSPENTGEAPKLSLSYSDLPPDGQVQLAAKAGIQLDPQILVAEKMKKHEDGKAQMDVKIAQKQKLT